MASLTDSTRVVATARSNRRRQPASAAFGRRRPVGDEADTRRPGSTAGALRASPASLHTAPPRSGRARARKRPTRPVSGAIAHL